MSLLIVAMLQTVAANGTRGQKIACEWSKSQMSRKSASKWQCEQRRTKNGRRKRYDGNVFITNCIKKHRTYLIVSVSLARKRNEQKKNGSKKSSVKHYRAQHFGEWVSGRWVETKCSCKFYICTRPTPNLHTKIARTLFIVSFCFVRCRRLHIIRLALRLSPPSTKYRWWYTHPNDDDDTQVPLTFSLCIAHLFLSFFRLRLIFMTIIFFSWAYNVVWLLLLLPRRRRRHRYYRSTLILCSIIICRWTDVHCSWNNCPNTQHTEFYGRLAWQSSIVRHHSSALSVFWWLRDAEEFVFKVNVAVWPVRRSHRLRGFVFGRECPFEEKGMIRRDR